MTEHSPETKVAILEAKVEHMMNHVTELTKRVRAVEKTCAIVSAIGIGGAGIVGTNIFNPPKAEAAPSAGEWIQRMRDWKSEQTRTAPEDSINNALLELEIDYGSDDTTEQKELLQFPSDGDQSSAGRRYDRCHHRSWIRFIQERTGKSCGSRHTGETHS